MTEAFDGEKGDVVCALDVVEHAPDDVAFVKRLLDLVKPGGVAVVSTPNKLVSYVLFGRLYEYHLREYGHAEIVRLTKAAGPLDYRVYCIDPGYISSLGMADIAKSRLGAKIPLALREWAKARWVGLKHLLGGQASPEAIAELFNDRASARILNVEQVGTPEDCSDYVAIIRRP